MASFGANLNLNFGAIFEFAFVYIGIICVYILFASANQMCIYICMCVYICMCMCVCMYVCSTEELNSALMCPGLTLTCVYIYVCVCVCVCVCVVQRSSIVL